ncbi:SAF domain-containing protein [Georgenia subflava]|uniref:AFP-like domain-containing protein n=1 Tax=Georgenia subflava TaxID=1622177 RepID=A0A6N7EL19_9MICO|nr:SAF domain-containing protein [Georgenia subflava]MPV35964.1 hypothetical protein [Georgenia subflava]
MTTTTARRRAPAKPTSPPTAEGPPPRSRRRPWHLATAVALGALGVTIGAVTWSTTSAMTSVLVANDSLHRGDVITTAAFTTARIYDDSALDPVTPAELDDLLGQRLSLDIAAGSIVTHDAVTAYEPTKAGTYLVGVSLASARAPGSEILVGDRVLVVVTPTAGSAVDTADVTGVPTSTSAEVAAVNIDAETGETILDLLVPQADGPTLAAHAATGNVAVLLEPRGGE